MKPLYKVGDLVRIKNKYDPGANNFSYYCVFIQDEMLEKFGGKICKIRSCWSEHHNYNDAEIPDDGCMYKLEENNYAWNSSMFDPEF